MFDRQSDVVRFPSPGLFSQRHDRRLEISVAVLAPGTYFPVAREERNDVALHTFDEFAKGNLGEDCFPGDGVGFMDSRRCMD